MRERAEVILQTMQNIADYCAKYHDTMSYEDLGDAIEAHRRLKNILTTMAYDYEAVGGVYYLV